MDDRRPLNNREAIRLSMIKDNITQVAMASAIGVSISRFRGFLYRGGTLKRAKVEKVLELLKVTDWRVKDVS